MGKSLNSESCPVYSGAWWWLARPHFILPLYILVVGAVLAFAMQRDGASWPQTVGGVAAGYAVWTLFEYIMHRWMLHNRSTPFTKKVFWEALHKEHHLLRAMEDIDHHGIHPGVSLPFVLLVIEVVALLSTSAFALAAGAGWALGYFAYEALHWVFHAGTPGRGLHRIPLIRYLHECHEAHHLKDARRNYGFVTMLWDRCFKTYLR